MRRGRTHLAVIVVCIVLIVGFLGLMPLFRRSTKRAEKRVCSFANAINYDYKTPEKIYPYLTKELRSRITIDDFVQAFLKERSYPYLTPLFLNFEAIEMDEQHEKGIAIFSQAARLPGMFVTIGISFEDDDYYFEYFEPLIDGSYLNKFEKLP